MAYVHVTAHDLIVEVRGLDRLWALKSTLTIPLAHVRGATPDPGIAHESAGLRVGGTYVPGVITAGTFRQEGEQVFWDVRNPARAVVIELRDETYARLVIEVEDPRATAELVQAALT